MKSTQKPVTNINGKVRLGWFIMVYSHFSLLVRY